MWNETIFLKNSDVVKALDKVSAARQALLVSDMKTAAQQISDTLELDPKCLDALGLIFTLPAQEREKLRNVQIVSSQAMANDIAELARGAEAVEHLLRNNGQLEEYHEILEHELVCMKQRMNHLKRCLENAEQKTSPRQQPLHLADIVCRFSSIQTDIAHLKASGITEKGIWGTVIHSENFVGLLSIPKVQSLVNRFYNHETKMLEDPRLVQLAMVLMLSQSNQLYSFEQARTEEEFFKRFERQLQKQFQALEQQMGLLPPH